MKVEKRKTLKLFHRLLSNLEARNCEVICNGRKLLCRSKEKSCLDIDLMLRKVK